MHSVSAWTASSASEAFKSDAPKNMLSNITISTVNTIGAAKQSRHWCKQEANADRQEQSCQHAGLLIAWLCVCVRVCVCVSPAQCCSVPYVCYLKQSSAEAEPVCNCQHS